MRFRYLLTLAFSLLPLSALASPIEVANGRWGFDPNSENREAAEAYSCSNDPIIISIDVEAKRYRGSRSDYTDLADILEIGPNFLKIAYDDETRLMDNGEPHVWVMLLIDADRFVWIREDWFKEDGLLGHTEPRYRCEPGTS